MKVHLERYDCKGAPECGADTFKRNETIFTYTKTKKFVTCKNCKKTKAYKKL